MYHKPQVTYENGLESNIFGIAQQICQCPPKQPCSYNFIMDHECDPDIEFDLIKDFTLACMKILFGENVTPNDLNEGQFDKLQSYIQSVGYHLNVNRVETETEVHFHISFDRYKSVKPNPFTSLKKYMSDN